MTREHVSGSPPTTIRSRTSASSVYLANRARSKSGPNRTRFRGAALSPRYQRAAAPAMARPRRSSVSQCAVMNAATWKFGDDAEEVRRVRRRLAARYAATAGASSSGGTAVNPRTPSPARAALAKVAWLVAATQSGGCGFWTGFGTSFRSGIS